MKHFWDEGGGHALSPYRSQGSPGVEPLDAGHLGYLSDVLEENSPSRKGMRALPAQPEGGHLSGL